MSIHGNPDPSAATTPATGTEPSDVKQVFRTDENNHSVILYSSDGQAGGTGFQPNGGSLLGDQQAAADQVEQGLEAGGGATDAKELTASLRSAMTERRATSAPPPRPDQQRPGRAQQRFNTGDADADFNAIAASIRKKKEAAILRMMEQQGVPVSLIKQGGRARSMAVADHFENTLQVLSKPQGPGLVLGKAEVLSMVRMIQRDVDLGLPKDPDKTQYYADTKANKIMLCTDTGRGQEDMALLSFDVKKGLHSKQKLVLRIENQKPRDKDEDKQIAAELGKQSIQYKSSTHYADGPKTMELGVHKRKAAPVSVREFVFDTTRGIASVKVTAEGVEVERR